MELKEVYYQSGPYLETVALREEVLRKPLGMTFTPEELQRDLGSHHLAIFENNKPLACLILTPLNATQIKMRQVAVAPHLQKQGLGAKLLAFAESFSREKGFQEITLHARQVAVGFYRKLGYHLEGEPFLEVGIPHFKMWKPIRQKATV